MPTYFESIGSKPTTRNDERFSTDGAEQDKLYKFYDTEAPELTKADKCQLDQMYKQWLRDMFLDDANIIIHQSSSSYTLLCQFQKSYLTRVPDYLTRSESSGKSTLDVTTVMLHGRCAISLPLLCHSLMLNLKNTDENDDENVDDDDCDSGDQEDDNGSESDDHDDSDDQDDNNGGTGHRRPKGKSKVDKLSQAERISFSSGGTSFSSVLTDDSIEEFIDSIRKRKKYFVFMVHSLELLRLESEPVFNIIFEKLIPLERKYLHFIVSMDQIASIKILDKDGAYSGCRIYDCDFSKFGGSHFYERQLIESLPSEQDCCSGKGGRNDGDLTAGKSASTSAAEGAATRSRQRLISKQNLSLVTLMDVYNALQKDCLKILIFIIRYFVDKSKELRTEEAASRRSVKFGDAGLPEATRKNGISIDDDDDMGSRRLTRSAVKGSKPKAMLSSSSSKDQSLLLDFETLMDFYSQEFVVRRANILRAHLGELIDHRIIKYHNEASSMIVCLVNESTGRKFLDYIERLNQEG